MITLRATPRTAFGKGAARKIRRDGFIPAVVYGPHDDNIHLNIDAHEFNTKYHYEASLIDFKVESSEEELKGVVRDIQYDPVTHEVLHLDFLHIHFGEPIEIDVNLNFIGTPIGIKKGGVFEEQLRTVHIRCLPSQIPEHIDVDVTHLDLGSVLSVSDLNVGDEIEILVDPETTLASVVIPRGMKQAEETSEEEATSEDTE